MESDAVFALLAEAVAEVAPECAERELTRSDSLAALGVGSLDRAEIVMSVLERLDLDLPLVDTHGPANLGELAELLSRASR